MFFSQNETLVYNNVTVTHEQDEDFSPEASVIIIVIRNYDGETPLAAETSDRLRGKGKN